MLNFIVTLIASIAKTTIAAYITYTLVFSLTSDEKLAITASIVVAMLTPSVNVQQVEHKKSNSLDV
jgi:hypothetical protein